MEATVLLMIFRTRCVAIFKRTELLNVLKYSVLLYATHMRHNHVKLKYIN